MTIATTWTKLKTGAWGLRGASSILKDGASVVVSKKSGELQNVTVGKVIWSGNGVALATVASSGSTSTSSRRTSAVRKSSYTGVRGCSACSSLGRMCSMCEHDEFDY